MCVFLLIIWLNKKLVELGYVRTLKFLFVDFFGDKKEIAEKYTRSNDRKCASLKLKGVWDSRTFPCSMMLSWQSKHAPAPQHKFFVLQGF